MSNARQGGQPAERAAHRSGHVRKVRRAHGLPLGELQECLVPRVGGQVISKCGRIGKVPRLNLPGRVGAGSVSLVERTEAGAHS